MLYEIDGNTGMFLRKQSWQYQSLEAFGSRQQKGITSSEDFGEFIDSLLIQK
jgi:hypothetical protein